MRSQPHFVASGNLGPWIPAAEHVQVPRAGFPIRFLCLPVVQDPPVLISWMRDRRNLFIYVSRSSDDGHTWSDPIVSPPGPFRSCGLLVRSARAVAPSATKRHMRLLLPSWVQMVPVIPCPQDVSSSHEAAEQQLWHPGPPACQWRGGHGLQQQGATRALLPPVVGCAALRIHHSQRGHLYSPMLHASAWVVGCLSCLVS